MIDFAIRIEWLVSSFVVNYDNQINICHDPCGLKTWGVTQYKDAVLPTKESTWWKYDGLTTGLVNRCWSYDMDKWLYPIINYGRNYLSMLWSLLIYYQKVPM